MKRIDVRFDNNTVALLKNIIGTEFEKFRCDPLDYSTLVYGMVGLFINGRVFQVDNYFEAQDFFGHQDDVAILKLHPAEESQIESQFVGVEMINTPIHSAIKRIRLVNENQQLFVNGEQTYDVWLTRGIIFDLEDGREVSFRKSIWFSEMIDVQRGYDVLNRYPSTDSFPEEWEECDGYNGICTREIRCIDGDSH